MVAWRRVGGSRFIAASVVAGLLTGSALGAVWLVVDSVAGDRSTKAFAELTSPARTVARVTAATPTAADEAFAGPVRSLEAMLAPETPLADAAARYLQHHRDARIAAAAEATAAARARSIGDALDRALDRLAAESHAAARRFAYAQVIDRARLKDLDENRRLLVDAGPDAATLTEAAERAGVNRGAAAARALDMERIAALLSVLREAGTAAERDAVRADLRRAAGRLTLMPRFDLVAAIETYAAALDRVQTTQAALVSSRTALANAGAGLAAALDGVAPGREPSIRRAGIGQDAGVAALILLSVAAGFGWAAWTLAGRRPTAAAAARTNSSVRVDREPLFDALVRRTAGETDRIPEPHRLLATLSTVDWPAPATPATATRSGGTPAGPRRVETGSAASDDRPPAGASDREHSPIKLHDLIEERMLQAFDSGAISRRPDDSVRSESALVARAVRTAADDLDGAIAALLSRSGSARSHDGLREAVIILTDATRQIGDLSAERPRTLDVRRLIGRGAS